MNLTCPNQMTGQTWTTIGPMMKTSKAGKNGRTSPMGMNSGSDKMSLDPAAWEDDIAEKARTVFKDAWELALNTEDDELFEKVWQAAARLVVDDVISGLVEKGLMEATGMLDGDMTYGLTPVGKLVVEKIEEEEGNV